MTRVSLGTLNDFESCAAQQVKLEGRTLTVVRIENDVYVLNDRCSHEDFSLSVGEVDCETREIECARHGAMFSLVDGAPTSLPATKAVDTYVVHHVDGRLEVEIP